LFLANRGVRPNQDNTGAGERLPTACPPDLLRALNPAKPLISWMESTGANAPWLFLALFAVGRGFDIHLASRSRRK
jgi:hypothetical protein